MMMVVMVMMTMTSPCVRCMTRRSHRLTHIFHSRRDERSRAIAQDRSHRGNQRGSLNTGIARRMDSAMRAITHSQQKSSKGPIDCQAKAGLRSGILCQIHEDLSDLRTGSTGTLM